MKDKLIKILQDMGKVAFTNKEKADYLLQHNVVPVVRCKDCIHSKLNEANEDYRDCNNFGCANPKDYFCADGERKTDETNT